MKGGSYFDLSKPVTVGKKRPASPAPSAPTASPTPDQPMTLAWQIATYLILLLSIVASRYLDLYRAGVASSFTLDWAYLLFAAVVSLLAFPVVYDRAQFSKNRPAFLQIGLIFSAGMGWEKILATAAGN